MEVTLRHKAILSDLLGDGVHAALVDIADHSNSLKDVERLAISNAGPTRVQEFSTGRWLARRLLHDLDVHSGSISVGLDRAPVWPTGTVGSISHGGGFCAVAVARRSAHRSLGIDIEPHRSVEPELWDEICTDDELAWLREHSAAAVLGTVMFSAKESVYKAVHPLIDEMLEFRDVELRIDPERQIFSCQILHPAGAAVPELIGQYREVPECVVTLVSSTRVDRAVTGVSSAAPPRRLKGPPRRLKGR